MKLLPNQKKRKIAFVFALVAFLLSGCVLFPRGEVVPDPADAVCNPPAFAGPTAEVRLVEGLWVATIDGELVFRSEHMGLAIQAAIDKLGPGIIHIRNRGELNDIIYPQSGQTLNFHNHPIGGTGYLRVYHQDHVTICNLHMNGSPIYSLNFHGSSHIHLHNIWLQFNGQTGGIRIDNDREKQVYTTDVKITGRMLIEGTRNHGFETYGIDGLWAEQIVTRNTAQSGVLLNETKNVWIGLIDAYRADPNGGYGCFRVANFNGPNVVVEKLIARECGRGFFSVSGSRGTTIKYVDIRGTNQQGILIQSSSNTQILGGVVTGYGERGVHITNGAHAGGDSYNNTIQNLRVYGSRVNNAYGILEGPGAWNNEFLNNDLRHAGANRSRDLVLRPGSGSVAAGNILTGDPPP